MKQCWPEHHICTCPKTPPQSSSDAEAALEAALLCLCPGHFGVQAAACVGRRDVDVSVGRWMAGDGADAQLTLTLNQAKPSLEVQRTARWKHLR